VVGSTGFLYLTYFLGILSCMKTDIRDKGVGCDSTETGMNCFRIIVNICGPLKAEISSPHE
jgi:hypothetical protein